MSDEDKSRDGKRPACGGVSRRGFISTVGAGAIAIATATGAETPPAKEVVDPEEMSPVTLTVNGVKQRLLVEPRWSLLFVLREKLGLAATKVGCERGECGACTVLVDDEPRYACLTLAVEAEGHAIVTLEGLMDGEVLGSTQQAFLDADAFQCGYCTPGQIMAVEGLLRADPTPDAEAIRRGVSGNLCRCGTYPNIFKAAQRAAELRGGKGETS